MIETAIPGTEALAETAEATPAASAKEVRAWALENGFEVGARGRIPASVKTSFTIVTGRQVA